MAASEKKAVPTGNRSVTVKLYKDREHREDKQVFLNGRQFIIQRGVEVKVPVGVAEILKNEERMQEIIAAYEQRFEEKLNG